MREGESNRETAREKEREKDICRGRIRETDEPSYKLTNCQISNNMKEENINFLFIDIT